MCRMKANITFIEYLEIACVTQRLILHALSTMSMFMSHIGCFGHECLEMRLYLSTKVNFAFHA